MARPKKALTIIHGTKTPSPKGKVILFDKAFMVRLLRRAYPEAKLVLVTKESYNGTGELNKEVWCTATLSDSTFCCDGSSLQSMETALREVFAKLQFKRRSTFYERLVKIEQALR